ncbi:MAG TPA: hypothetical protein DCM67_12725 [Propionibacteriaceae bacterium]|nr:hypothetical protein [Propionibacteriaceae bacterium]
MKIVHISPSVLAGAPGMLADAQRELLGHHSVHFRVGDPGPHRDLMSPNSIQITNNAIDREAFLVHLADAEVIHVHNFVPPLLLRWAASIPAIYDRTWIYQVHSPTHERPLFGDLSADHGVRWHAKLAVCHAHPRMFPDFRPIPNVLYRPFISQNVHAAPSPAGPLRVVHSPSTHSQGRWSAKSDPLFELEMDRLKADPRVTVETLEGVSPRKVAMTRHVSQVSIDEVITGGFHLVSYEGLAAGNVVINGADALSHAAFALGFRTTEPPPWIVTDSAGVHQEIVHLINDPGRLAELMAAGHDYFWRVMAPARVVPFYDEIYA